jgi:GTP-binding protein
MPSSIRNVAIIAHVDHGKTTLVDAMLRQSGTFRANQAVEECFLDANPLERERGITILAKNTVVTWRDTKINIIDTPGHADFGGEVERVLSMADGVLLLVDAAEGPLPQTRFVLSKAFSHKLRPVVVINKVDRPDARVQQVLNEVFDLFIELDCDEEQLDFPVLYGSGRQGWMSKSAEEPTSDINALMDTILAHVPPPQDVSDGPLRFRVTALDWSDYVGRIAVGRVHQGRMAKDARVLWVSRDGKQKEVVVRGVFGFEGISRREVPVIDAGDLCAVYGIDDINIGDSLTDVVTPQPLPPIAIDQPTMSIMLRVNDSPFAGRSGKFLTSRHLRDRLDRELRTNVALHVEPGDGPESFLLSGRGVMHLGILLENMRREGYEFAVSKPKVIVREIDSEICEPIEHLTVDCPENATGKVIEILGDRRAEMLNMTKKGRFQRIEFSVPARGLIGVRTRLLNATGGQATMHHVFQGYEPWRGPIAERTAGVLVSMAQGMSTFYALDSLRDRGTFFVHPQTEIYDGMIIGENCKEGDLVVNLSREKKLSNVRSSTKETFVKLLPPRIFSVEDALEYIADDELVEITPDAVRLRKAIRNEKDRRRLERAGVEE